MNELVERLRTAPPRSWLFVPALKAKEWIPKAVAAGADAVIVDLEDATAPAEKERAREFVRSLRLGASAVVGDAFAKPRRASDKAKSVGPARRVTGPVIFVRVNAIPRDAMEAELAIAVESGAAGVVLPKVDDPQTVVGAAWHGLALVPMIESARGLLRAADIASANELVAGLAFGSWDFAADVGAVHSPEGSEVAYARSMVVVAAAAGGVAAIDTPWLDLGDPKAAGREADRARRLGYSGKLAIHPAQIGPINAAFTPAADEVRVAQGIVDAFDRAVAAGSGVATFEGRMVDRPLVLAARRVLARAEMARERG